MRTNTKCTRGSRFVNGAGASYLSFTKVEVEKSTKMKTSRFVGGIAGESWQSKKSNNRGSKHSRKQVQILVCSLHHTMHPMVPHPGIQLSKHKNSTICVCRWVGERERENGLAHQEVVANRITVFGR